MKWRRVLLIASAVLLWRGVSAFADRGESGWRRAAQDQAMSFTLEGKISKLEKGKFTVSTEENIIFHVRYDDKAEIKHEDGTAASSKDLRVGLRVRIAGDLTESGEIVAKKIEIEKESSAPPPRQ